MNAESQAPLRDAGLWLTCGGVLGLAVWLIPQRVVGLEAWGVGKAWLAHGALLLALGTVRGPLALRLAFGVAGFMVANGLAEEALVLGFRFRGS